MKTLNKNSKIFIELDKNPPDWWNLIKSDKDLYIDIRKDNYIDVYHNGGNLIKELRHNGKDFTGSINYKYLLTDKSEYKQFHFINGLMSLPDYPVPLLSFNDINKKFLKRIKSNISSHYQAKSEKGIQAKFIKKAGQFIDSEFAYNYNNNKIRIDLVWIDIRNHKIIFVELKTMGDSRLYTDEINIQLRKYNDFAKKYNANIVKYYQQIFTIKKMLNLLPQGLSNIPSIKNYQLENKPLLLFGDCQQKWIDNNAQDINNRIKDVAVGAYYFGGTKYDCSLIPKIKRNRYVF